MSKNKNIILCGFMGCGKTTVGKALAKKLGFTFVDTDRAIENEQKTSIKTIFERKGEEYFRELEHLQILSIADKKNSVISVGGGALCFERNVNAIKDENIIVFIDVTLSTVKRRLKNDTTRPLLNNTDKDKALISLYNSRKPLYENASHIKVDGIYAPTTVVDKIIEQINNLE